MNHTFHPNTIKAQMAYLGLSQAELAKRTKSNGPRLSRLFTGKFAPHPEELSKINKVLAGECARAGLKRINVVSSAQHDGLLPVDAEPTEEGLVRFRLGDTVQLVSPAMAYFIVERIEDALDDVDWPIPRHRE